jgi:hypothetical protein
MTQENARGPWLAPALVALAAATAGLAVGWYLRGSSGAEQVLARPTEAQAADGVKREEIASLKRELLARLDELARVRATNSPAAADGQVIELGRRIDDLDARIALLGSSAGKPARGPAWATTRGPGSGSIDSMRERIAAWTKAGEYASQADALVREHQLWTMEDVLQAYGTPARVLDYNDAWTLAYGPFQEEGEELPCMIEFRFREGLVWEVNFDCSGRYR